MDTDRLWVIGVIDTYDAVHSEGFDFFDDIPYHGDLYPNIVHKRWRWTASEGIERSRDDEEYSSEEFDRIIQHISKKYKVKLNQYGISEDY